MEFVIDPTLRNPFPTYECEVDKGRMEAANKEAFRRPRTAERKTNSNHPLPASGTRDERLHGVNNMY